MNRFQANVAILSVLINCIFTSCHNNTEKETHLRNVIITRPQFQSKEKFTLYPGVVEEGASINAAFMAEGKINKVNFKEGDRVRKGQLLALLDDSDYRIGVAQLETQYNQMTKEKERMDAMFEKHNIAPNDYEKFVTGYEQLKLQLDMVKRKHDYTHLYSPANGYISTVYLHEGELVGAGTPVFNIVDDTKLMVSVDLPVSLYLEKDKISGAVGSVPGINKSIPLNILSFTPDADNNMLYHMKLEMPAKISKELTPGMNISVNIVSSDSNDSGMLVPSRSLMNYEGKTYVWVLNDFDSTIQKKEVILKGQPLGNMSLVEGMDMHDKIVETGVKQLFEGEKVNVLKKEELGL